MSAPSPPGTTGTSIRHVQPIFWNIRGACREKDKIYLNNDVVYSSCLVPVVVVINRTR